MFIASSLKVIIFVGHSQSKDQGRRRVGIPAWPVISARPRLENDSKHQSMERDADSAKLGDNTEVMELNNAATVVSRDQRAELEIISNGYGYVDIDNVAEVATDEDSETDNAEKILEPPMNELRYLGEIDSDRDEKIVNEHDVEVVRRTTGGDRKRRYRARHGTKEGEQNEISDADSMATINHSEEGADEVAEDDAGTRI